MATAGTRNGSVTAASRRRGARSGPHPVNERALRRLKNIEGQARGLQRMVEEEAYCPDILAQIEAVRAALKSVGLLILRRHIETCVVEAIRAGGEERARIMDELIAVLARGDTD
jgi:DNA-binding FrmR family transcriptional regulator